MDKKIHACKYCSDSLQHEHEVRVPLQKTGVELLGRLDGLSHSAWQHQLLDFCKRVEEHRALQTWACQFLVFGHFKDRQHIKQWILKFLVLPIQHCIHQFTNQHPQLTLPVFDGGQLLVHSLVSGFGEGFSCGTIAVMDQVGRHHSVLDSENTQ